ncbi:MAG TPA: hypothetical protein VMV69_03910 [Pirellulales bacterium]|nr:hypothetical protein [Pirellulales bacterium]
MSHVSRRLWAALVAASLVAPALAAGAPKGLDQKGKPDLKFAGPLAFAPEGVLLVGDPLVAAVFAIDTHEQESKSAGGAINVKQIDQKIAALLGASADQILINDLAVNPATGTVYMSVSRGRGPQAAAVIVRMDHTGKLSEFALDDVDYARAALPNAPNPTAKDRRGDSQRLESITDLAYLHGRVIVAGLSNEEFASKLRSLPFPFDGASAKQGADEGASVEIYHGSHGKFETQSPVRTFVPFTIEGEPCLLAAYTCTPLVKFPLSQLSPGAKVQGVTIAELGNQNRPLDMIVYQKDGADFVLMANDRRGVMKIPTDDFAGAKPIKERVPDKAGVGYETIADLKGVVQLDRLDAENAFVLLKTDAGELNGRTVPLP